MDGQLKQRSVAAGHLWSLAGSIELLLEQHRAGLADGWWTVVQLRAALEHSLDLLLTIATELGLDSPDSRSATATRDAVEIRLRATVDLDDPDLRSTSVARLLVDAGALVIAEAAIHHRQGPVDQPRSQPA
jgi:hypothetical protein